MKINPYKKSHYAKMLEHLQRMNKMWEEYFANKTKPEKENLK